MISGSIEVQIEIIDDPYDGLSDERFMVIASLEGDTFNGRVRLNPSPIIISIEDNDPRPGMDSYNNSNPVVANCHRLKKQNLTLFQL